MSVADRLGTGSSFGGVPRGRSARGRAKAMAQGEVPAYELAKLPLAEVSPTPLNPRRNFGTEEELARFGEELRKAQLAACVAVTRDAYLRLWPEHESRIGPEARYVLVNGERRYRSAAAVQLETLDFVVRDDLAATREDFIDRLLKENLDREDFDVIERARGVQQMVDVCGGDGARGSRLRASERLGRDRSWVTNQLALLTLPEELQGMLSRGELSERDGRALARRLKDEPELTSEGLLEQLAKEKEQDGEKRQREKALLQAARERGKEQAAGTLLSADNKSAELAVGEDPDAARPPRKAAGGSSLSADNKPAEPGGAQGPGEAAGRAAQPESSSSATEPEGFTAVKRDEAEESAAAAAHEEGGSLLSADNEYLGSDASELRHEPELVPWHDPEALHSLLQKRMSWQHRRELTKLLLDSNGDR